MGFNCGIVSQFIEFCSPLDNPFSMVLVSTDHYRVVGGSQGVGKYLDLHLLGNNLLQIFIKLLVWNKVGRDNKYFFAGIFANAI